MKITVEQEKLELSANPGQIYGLDNGSHYIVASCGYKEGKEFLNLINLSTGNRWSYDMDKAELNNQIKSRGFKLVHAKELIIKELI